MSALRDKLENRKARANEPGLSRFLVHLGALLACLEKAREQKNQALALYQSTARQCLFYLQALCRAYKKVGTKKRFKEMGESFKGLEDQLGQIDYWDGWIKDCAACNGFPEPMMRVLRKHKDREVAALQGMLDKGRWMEDDFAALEEILDSLTEEDWDKADKDREKIARFFQEEIEEIEAACRSGEYDFHELEAGIHEFRRQLRWIGIYAFAFDGLIQLRRVAKSEPCYEKYLTDAVLRSAFNDLPSPKVGIAPLVIEAPDYYALNWMLSQLGQLKDRGQKIIALQEVAKESGYANPKKLEEVFSQLIPDAAQRLAGLSAAAVQLVEGFVVKDRILQRLAQALKPQGQCKKGE